MALLRTANGMYVEGAGVTGATADDDDAVGGDGDDGPPFVVITSLVALGGVFSSFRFDAAATLLELPVPPAELVPRPPVAAAAAAAAEPVEEADLLKKSKAGGNAEVRWKQTKVRKSSVFGRLLGSSSVICCVVATPSGIPGAPMPPAKPEVEDDPGARAVPLPPFAFGRPAASLAGVGGADE